LGSGSAIKKPGSGKGGGYDGSGGGFILLAGAD
jgi:hypothetical protein